MSRLFHSTVVDLEISLDNNLQLKQLTGVPNYVTIAPTSLTALVEEHL